MALDPQVQLKLIETADIRAWETVNPNETRDVQLDAYLKQFKKIYGELTKAIDTEPTKPHTSMSDRFL